MNNRQNRRTEARKVSLRSSKGPTTRYRATKDTLFPVSAVSEPARNSSRWCDPRRFSERSWCGRQSKELSLPRPNFGRRNSRNLGVASATAESPQGAQPRIGRGSLRPTSPVCNRTAGQWHGSAVQRTLAKTYFFRFIILFWLCADTLARNNDLSSRHLGHARFVASPLAQQTMDVCAT
jgi:hypothetical protein